MHAGDSVLTGYHLLHTVRGDFLAKLGRLTEAREENQRAITMTHNLRERELLMERLERIDNATSA
jgi:predicted RNA polymerase sigma factor